MPLAPDEAYYWVWSRALQAGYLDHPPMVALWIRAGTALAGDTPLGIRLLSPFAAAVGSVLLAWAAEDLLPQRRAGLVAAALMNATLWFGVGAVTATPDTPLLLFWTGTLWALARLLRTGNGAWWLVAGGSAGLALDSKYTAVLLFPAVVLWLAFVPSVRVWLRRPVAWAGAALAGGMFLPVLWWNAAHQWASFAKQGGRVDAWQPARALQFVGELLGGQLGLATPLVAVLCGAGIVLAARRSLAGEPAWALLTALTIVPALVFLQHAMGDRVQANWPSVIYPAAAIAAAGLSGGWMRFRASAIALGFGLTALVWIQAVAAPLALPMRLDPTLLRLGGWPALAADVAETAQREQASFVASDNYGHVALLALLLPAGIQVIGVDRRWSLFDLPDATPLLAGRTGLLLRSARRADAPDPADWASVERVGVVDRGRDGVTAEAFGLYRVTGRTNGVTAATMPRPR